MSRRDLGDEPTASQRGGQSSTERQRALDVVSGGATTTIGALPHTDPAAAAQLVLAATELPAIANLPCRSPREGALAQALNGVPGVTVDGEVTISVDRSALDPSAPVSVDLGGESFGGWRAAVAAIAERCAAGDPPPAVKWEFAGPLSVGSALCRAGVEPGAAFAVAGASARAHLVAMADALDDATGGLPQLILLDEMGDHVLARRELPIPLEDAIDLLSASMAVLERRATIGVHSCGNVDLVALLESGPQVVSIPVRTGFVQAGGYLARFLANGGWVAWGAVPTTGPIGSLGARSTQALMSLWRDLVARGCDPEALRAQSLITPECGLRAHSLGAVDEVVRAVRDVGAAVRGDAMGTGLRFGR